MLFTIGHGLMTLDEMKELMDTHEIDYLIDVRSVPFSSHNPDFNRENLIRELGKKYIWKGDSLGGKHPDCLDEQNRTDYEKVVKTKPETNRMLKKILTVSERFNVMLMCSETDPAKCHRSRMLGRELYFNEGTDIIHLVSGKGEMRQSELMEKMSGGEWKEGDETLFGKHEPYFKSSRPAK